MLSLFITRSLIATSSKVPWERHTHRAIQCLSLLVWWEFCGAIVSAFLVVADLKFCKSPSIQRFMMPASSLHSSFVSLGKKRKWGSCTKLPIKEVQCTCKMKMCISFKDDMNLQLYPPPHLPVMSCVGFFFTQFTWRVCGLQFCGLYS